MHLFPVPALLTRLYSMRQPFGTKSVAISKLKRLQRIVDACLKQQ